MNELIASTTRRIFGVAVQLVFGVILLFLVLGIAIGTIQLFLQLGGLLRFEGVTGQYIDIITDVLTLYVLVELSRSLVEYFDSGRLKLALVIDAAIVFILREILIGIFKHNVAVDMLYALVALIFVLGALRTAAVLAHSKEIELLRTIDSQPAEDTRPPG